MYMCKSNKTREAILVNGLNTCTYWLSTIVTTERFSTSIKHSISIAGDYWDCPIVLSILLLEQSIYIAGTGGAVL